jgi:hypothetical protein
MTGEPMNVDRNSQGLKYQASAAFSGDEARKIYDDLIAVQPLPLRIKSLVTQAAASFLDAVRGRGTKRDYKATITYDEFGGHTIYAAAPSHNAMGHKQRISFKIGADQNYETGTNMGLGRYASLTRELADAAAADNAAHEGGTIARKYEDVMTQVKTAYDAAPKLIPGGGQP